LLERRPAGAGGLPDRSREDEHERDQVEDLGEDLRSSTYLIAGPPPMVDGVAETLGSAGVPEDQIRPARFSGY